MKVIVAGGRGFNDDKLLEMVLRQEQDAGMTTVISGMAAGADRLGLMWARRRGLWVMKMPADWQTHGRSAGYRRNAEMADVGDRLVAFWDGVSKGTAHMIKAARDKGLPVRVIRYAG